MEGALKVKKVFLVHAVYARRYCYLFIAPSVPQIHRFDFNWIIIENIILFEHISDPRGQLIPSCHRDQPHICSSRITVAYLVKIPTDRTARVKK